PCPAAPPLPHRFHASCYTHNFMVQEVLQSGKHAIDAALERLLPPPTRPPESIHRAMRHSVFAGGKRLRPILCLEAARMIAGSLPAGIEELGSALEMLHTYSLIHDDLPALDNDDLRRVHPTWPVVDGEATASLVTGGLYAGCGHAELQRLRDFGRSVGLAFQIIDDVLDVTQSSAQLGKTAGKDQAVEKATYPALFGLEASIKQADMLVASGC